MLLAVEIKNFEYEQSNLQYEYWIGKWRCLYTCIALNDIIIIFPSLIIIVIG